MCNYLSISAGNPNYRWQPMADLLDDPIEIGKRIGAACGYAFSKKQTDIARDLGVTDVTLRSYIKGNLGDFNKSRETRLMLIRAVEKATRCPPAIFSVSELTPAEANLRREFEQKLLEQANELRAEAEKTRAILEAQLSSRETGVRKKR